MHLRKQIASDLIRIDVGALGEPRQDFLLTIERHESDIDHEMAPRPYVYSVTKRGLIARWRGTALAYPLVDATLLRDNLNRAFLCALHRGDSFISPNAVTSARRSVAYRWNGFGFTVARDANAQQQCVDYFAK